MSVCWPALRHVQSRVMASYEQSFYQCNASRFIPRHLGRVVLPPACPRTQPQWYRTREVLILQHLALPRPVHGLPSNLRCACYVGALCWPLLLDLHSCPCH